jgi:hypothetical protein
MDAVEAAVRLVESNEAVLERIAADDERARIHERRHL